MNDDSDQLPQVFEYASPTQRPQRSFTWGSITTLVMAVVWIFAAGEAGVGSDFARIATPKKIALFVSAVIIFTLLTLQPIHYLIKAVWIVLAVGLLLMMLVLN